MTKQNPKIMIKVKVVILYPKIISFLEGLSV